MISNPISYPEPESRPLSDSDRNIMHDLAGEADEPCDSCGDMVRPSPCNPPGSFEFEYETELGQPLCENCAS